MHFSYCPPPGISAIIRVIVWCEQTKRETKVSNGVKEIAAIMLYNFRRAPKDTHRLYVTKPWHTQPKFVRSMAIGLSALAIGIGSYLMPEVHAYTADAFVMVVKTDNPGTSNATSFTIPITGTGYSYNVDCNDDGVNEVTARTTSYTCVYGTAGTYTVAITGTFPRIYFNNAGDRQKLLEVKQWGTGAWTSMQNAFYGAINLHITATDAPNLAGVTNMSGMFRDATSMNENINHWNTSNIKDMSYLFSGLWYDGTKNVYASFNQPLNSWDTSAVTNMSNMFYGASAFNQPLTNFNTSAVTDMSYMFYNASAFNQPLTNFNTSAVTNMSSMFAYASAFNQPLTNFNTSAVTNMSSMFFSASAFNQPLTNFNTSAVTNMSWMFSNASAFNQPLTNFNTSAVTDMSWMFSGATAFNQPLTNFNTSAVTSMSNMFDYSDYTTATYDQTLLAFASQSLQPNVPLGAAGIPYCNETVRNILTSAPNNWTIIDGGFCPPAVSSPANLAVVTPAGFSITGTAYPSRTVHVDIDGVTGTVLAAADGSYSFTPATPLATGWHTATLRSTDQSGAPGVSTIISFYVHSGGTVVLSGNVIAPALSWPTAPNTGVATTWQQTANGATSFPARGSFGAAELGGKLWVVGGQGTSSRLNDVWSSSDGIAWKQELAHAPFSARNAHTVTAFDGKLWVMGGQTGNTSTRRSDIWSSPDGVNWTQEVANAPWGPRAAHETVVHDGKLWIMGGADATDTEYTDVWNSSDGINWTRVTDTVSWPSRRGFAATSFNDKLWVMGGLINDWDVFENDVWSSTDGVTWTEETADAAWQVRASHQVEVFDNKMWVLGGSSDSWDSEYSDVWFSENGKDWIRTTEAADWQARRGHSSAVFNDKLWVLGGRVGSGWVTSNDVWSAGIPAVTYTVCWDTTAGGCSHTANVTNVTTFTIPDDLAKGTWHFKVTASIPGANGTGTYTSTPYQVTDPLPVVVPLAGKPVIHPVTGAASTVTVAPTLAEASLSVSSYDCSDLQTPSVRLIEPDGLKVAEANVTLLGGVGFTVGCTSNGKSTDVALALGAHYPNTSNLRAYKQSGASLVDITKQVTFTNKDVNGTMKTVVNYNLVDGGSLDEDGVVNGSLVDPIFIGVIDGGSLANTGFNVYALLALAAALLTSAAAIWRKGVKAPKRMSFR